MQFDRFFSDTGLKAEFIVPFYELEGESKSHYGKCPTARIIYARGAGPQLTPF